MGGLQPADPGNAIGGGVKRAWSYLKLLRTESTGIPTLFWNNQVCDSNRAIKLMPCVNSMSLHARTYVLFRHCLGPLLYPDILELHETVSELVKMKLLQKIDTCKATGPDLYPG